MKNVNILHVAPAYQIRGGGIFEVVENLSSVQCQQDAVAADVLALTDFVGGSKGGKVIYDLLPARLCQVRLIFLTLIFLTRKLKAYDVIHIHGAWSAQFLLILPFICFYRGKITYQPHGLLSPEPMKKSGILKKLAWVGYQRYFIIFCKTIICCSERERLHLIELCNTKGKTVIIPNGLDSIFFADNLYSAPRKDRLLYFSQVVPIKNLESLFYALSLLKERDGINVFLDIYGYGPNEYLRRLKKLLNDLSLNDNVDFKGVIAREDRVSIYDNYKYFILPSLSENFGISVLEAISRGCKVLVSQKTPWANVKDRALTVFDVDPESIYLTLKPLFSDKGSGQCTNSNQEMNIEDFRWDNIALKFYSIY